MTIILLQGIGQSKESMESEASTVESDTGNGNFVECHICGDHILKDFLSRHIKMNHPQVRVDEFFNYLCQFNVNA